MTLQELIESFSTFEDFVSAVDAKLLDLMNGQPDFRYNTGSKYAGCSYIGPAKLSLADDSHVSYGPACLGCIFGQVFQLLGVSRSELDFRVGIESLIEDIQRQQNKCPQHWIKIQNAQDGGATWGSLRGFME